MEMNLIEMMVWLSKNPDIVVIDEVGHHLKYNNRTKNVMLFEKNKWNVLFKMTKFIHPHVYTITKEPVIEEV